MENKINKIITLGNNMKFLILKQAVYKNENYFIVVGVKEDETDTNDSFNILHETKRDNKTFVEIERDPSIVQLILKHIEIKED